MLFREALQQGMTHKRKAGAAALDDSDTAAGTAGPSSSRQHHPHAGAGSIKSGGSAGSRNVRSKMLDSLLDDLESNDDDDDDDDDDKVS